MNTTKIREAIKMIADALSEPTDVTEEQWLEFGRACDDAIRARYCVDDVARAEKPNSNWRPVAVRLWNAAKPLGLHGLKHDYSRT